MSMHAGWGVMRSLTRDSSVAQRKLAPGTAKRVIAYARPYKSQIVVFLILVILDSALVVATPLLLGQIIDNGVIPGDSGVVVRLSLIIAVIAVLDGALTLVQRWYSSRIGEGLIFDLRTQVFSHVLKQPIAFFTRAQTGALVSRLNNDVIGAQQAFTSTLSGVVSNVVSLLFIITAMATKSWVLTLAALALLPFFLIPARVMGRRLAGLSHEAMGLNAELGTRMTERFNVAGALLVKLFGHPKIEDEQYAERAGRVRDVGVKIALTRTVFFVALTLVASLATAFIYGAGGVMAVKGTLQVGELVALAALLGRLYGPLTALSNVRVDVMTALVSFERVFEVLDLPPMIDESPRAVPLPPDPRSIEFDDVQFSYPTAAEVSLASLEDVAVLDNAPSQQVLHGVSFRAGPGQLGALVGPSGAGKTTISQLPTRMYDVRAGAVRIDGHDVRDVTLQSLRDAIGVVTQDAHMFHDSIRANLLYAKPDAADAELDAALTAAQIGDLVASLPDGLDTVVGDRGYRLSGGEKQRLAIARLLLKAPGIVILDEATAHLDSESEVAVQRALKIALRGRTSLVIAHRLSTIREADQILVIDGGRVVESGRHDELLAADGLYAELYRTQFERQADSEASPLADGRTTIDGMVATGVARPLVAG